MPERITYKVAVLTYRAVTGDVPQYLRQFVRVADVPSRHRLRSAQRMYLLKLLRHQGMSAEQLSVVTYSIIVSRTLYALPAWGGFLSAELTNKINALFRGLKRFGYTTCNITVSDLIDTSGRDLFRKLFV